MRRFWKRFAAVVLAALVVTTSVSAAPTQEEQAAQSLYGLGLFLGTDIGFELSRTPKRSEALIIMVRLLGKEAEALSGSTATPFADIPAWFAPYAAYAYRTGLTQGTGEDAVTGRSMFGTYSDTGRAEFLTFVLRALGYDDTAGDFTWSEADAFADELGLLNGTQSEEGLTRGDCAVIALNALSTECKTGGTLADELVREGVLSREAALGAGAALTEPSRINTTGYDDETVLSYFREIAFDTELGESVDAIRKWTSPIYYEIHGTATEDDLALLTRLVAALDTVEGFPGMYDAAAAETQPNFHIYFMDAADIPLLEDGAEDSWGLATTWWYTATKVIHSARVAVANDVTTQEQRNTVILEETIQALGLTQDS
ncbi:MAG TPA: DUF2927 domain-containing protein, partial [Oscillospiraceae bacterium]|nr:DUF2927 domain-containing protein [Oscillospiraceae bacterium]